MRTLPALFLLASVAMADPAHEAARLLDSANAQYNAKKYDRAIELYLAAVDASREAPDQTVWTIRRDGFYNAACCYALQQLRTPALWYLDSALRNGFWDALHIRYDHDLDFVRGGATFDSLIGEIPRMRESQLRAALTAPSPSYRPSSLKQRLPAPLLVVMHPEGERAEETLERWEPIADSLHAALVCPRAPKLLAPFQFGYHLDSDSMSGAIVRAIAVAREEGTIDSTRIVLAGHGVSGYIAVTYAFKHARIFHGAVDVNGFVNIEAMRQAFPVARKSGLCVAGLYDAESASAQSSLLRAAQAFREADINHRIGVATRKPGESVPVEEVLSSLRWILE